MTNDCTFTITTTRFDEDYSPAESSRVTTNFANLARGADRQQNLRNAITMMNSRVNSLTPWDNSEGDRYSLELDIVSASLGFAADGEEKSFPLIEVLEVHIVDQYTGKRHQGIVGNNFSSYVRDYDFSVRLPAAAAEAGRFTVPTDFGDLHGKLFDRFVSSDAYQDRFTGSPVICISVSTTKSYTRTTNVHPVLGVEYVQPEPSLTDAYFGKMGLLVRYFLPAGSAAPLAFYFRGDLLNDYTNLQLAGTIATMETFQKIYRPEIYNANSPAAAIYRPTLEQQDFSRTQVDYDRVERAECAATQGAYTDEFLIKPYGELLERWVSRDLSPVC